MTSAYFKREVVSGSNSLQFFSSSQNPLLIPTQGLENLGIVNQKVFSVTDFIYRLRFDAKLIAYYINGTVDEQAIQCSLSIAGLTTVTFNQLSPISNNSTFYLVDEEEVTITNTNVNNPLLVRLVLLPFFRDTLFNP